MNFRCMLELRYSAVEGFVTRSWYEAYFSGPTVMTPPRTSAGRGAQYRPSIAPTLAEPRRSRPSNNVAGVVAHQELQLRELLRRRLLVSVSVIVGFFGLLPLSSLRFIGSPDVPTAAQIILGSQWLVAILCAGLGVLVAHRPTRSLHTLRV